MANELTTELALRLMGGEADVGDDTWDSEYAWDVPDIGDTDPYSKVTLWIIKNTELVRADAEEKHLVCDIAGFCTSHWGMMQAIFEEYYKERLADDPTDEAYYASEDDVPLLYIGEPDEDGRYTTGEESLFHAVEAIGSIMVGDFADSGYEWILDNYINKGE